MSDSSVYSQICGATLAPPPLAPPPIGEVGNRRRRGQKKLDNEMSLALSTSTPSLLPYELCGKLTESNNLWMLPENMKIRVSIGHMDSGYKDLVEAQSSPGPVLAFFYTS